MHVLVTAGGLSRDGQPEPTPPPTWRERHEARTGVDPLVCPRCGTPMELEGYYFGSVARLCLRFGLEPGERIDYRQGYRDSG